VMNQKDHELPDKVKIAPPAKQKLLANRLYYEVTGEFDQQRKLLSASKIKLAPYKPYQQK
jgi:hypothetical protein